MKLHTRYLGEVTIDPDKVLHFPNGLPGFPEETKFVLLDLPGNPVFQTLQSVKTSEIAFIVTNPYYFYAEYTFHLDKQIIEQLRIQTEADVMVLSIVTIKDPFDQSTLNLKAPIIMNATIKIGKQYILNENHFPVKASIKSTKEKGE